MNPTFIFTPAHRDAIAAPSRQRGYPDPAIVEFLDIAAGHVADWQERWPPLDAEQLRAGKRRLDNIAKHLRELHYELNTIDTHWKIPLWAQLDEHLTGHPVLNDLASKKTSMQAAWRDTGNRLELHLEAFRRIVEEHVDNYSLDYGRNGRNNAGKVDLLLNLAWAFHHCFATAPTTTKTGPFVAAAAAIGDAIDLPIGEDAIGSAVAAWRTGRDNFLNDGEHS